MRRAALAFLALLIGAAAPGAAQEARSSLLPEVPRATGAPHPEGNEYWRRNHMDLMRHDRDLTLRAGQREIGASLKGCFECHAATDDAGQIVVQYLAITPLHFTLEIALELGGSLNLPHSDRP